MSTLDVRLTADGGSVVAVRGGVVAAEGRLRRTRAGWEIAMADATALAGPDEAHVDVDGVAAVLTRLREIVGRTGEDAARWLVSAPTADHDAAADLAGLTVRRDLLQLRRPLPVDPGHRDGVPPLVTRPFRPGQDEQAWVTANNRSFAAHPDQRDKTVADVVALEAEPWFDAAGFLLLDADDRPGQLDGFCWTKVHPPRSGGPDPALGEIYVIGVDPAAQGRHLGPALTVAGLDHLHAAGIDIGMLYVDVANAGAVRMYDRLGFTTHHLDRIYSAP